MADEATAADEAPVAEDTAVEDTAVEAAVDAREGATATQPYGPGSKSPLKSGNAPKGFAIKGVEDSKTYYAEGSESYDQAVAGVWFETDEAAEAAGFSRAG